METLALLVLGVQDVDNPEFAGWAMCKDGARVTYVTYIQESLGAGKDWRSYTFTLVDLSADRAVVEIAVKNPEGGGLDVNPNELPGFRLPRVGKRTIPARIRKTDARIAEGDAEIEVAGKKRKCRWTEWETEEIRCRTWWCDEIPGGIARQEWRTGDASSPNVTILKATGWEKK